MTASPNLPMPLLLLNGIGALLIAVGAMGLTSPDLMPPLAAPGVAWALIGAGALIDGGAALGIVLHLRRRPAT
ncbi:MAG: hypothetical protein AB7I01_20785 [Gammaproteobacteria bacterium]